MDNIEQEFHEAWIQVWHAIGTTMPDVQMLLTRYREPQRHYHNALHIVDCLRQHSAACAKNKILRSIPLQLALFYHDAIYNPRAHDNEAQSAALAKSDLAGHLSSKTIEEVIHLIIITEHRHIPAQEDARLIADIDLSILGRPADIFHRYEIAIRKEYDFVTDADFQSGRIRILKSFLARPRIYHTPLFFQQYEAAARVNLERSLAQSAATA